MALTYFQLKGEQFIAGANRDIYVGKSAKQIKDTLLSIERLDGPTSAVIQKGSDGAVNTVTSTVTGYLFGECLWEHLKKENKVSAEKIIPKLLAIAKNRTDTRIYVRGDKNINYGRVLEIMGTLSGAGFSKVALISEPYKS